MIPGPAHLTRALARWRDALVFGLLLVFVGCGASLPVTHRTAANLRLAIQIYGQRGKLDYVSIEVHAYEGSNPQGVILADKARLTCDGVDIKTRSPAGVAGMGGCPRQPPGGAYKIAYTDEHGASTIVTVPAPTGPLAILSPASDSSVPIPTNGALAVRVSLPIAPPNGSIMVDNISAICGAYPNPCGNVSATVQNDAPPTASAKMSAALTIGASDRRAASATSNYAFSATPTPPATSTPQPLAATPTPESTLAPAATPTQSQSSPPASATLTRDGSVEIITLRGDFSLFSPNAGAINVWARAEAIPDPGGFAAVTATFDTEYLSSAIVWTR